MSWTQAICDVCWDKQHPDRPSPGTAPGEWECCSFCGQPTKNGIYVRADPDNVPFPRRES